MPTGWPPCWPRTSWCRACRSTHPCAGRCGWPWPPTIAPTPAALERELAADGTSAGRIGFLSATSAFPDPDGVARSWRNLTASDELTNDEVDATIRGLRAGPSTELLEPYRAAYFDLLERFWFDRSIEIAQRLVIGLYPRTGSTADVDAWLAAHPGAPRALLRLVIEQRDSLQRLS